MNVTKIIKLISHNVAALAAHADRLGVQLGKTTATFNDTPAYALDRVRVLRAPVKAERGGRTTEAVSVVAVIRRLEA